MEEQLENSKVPKQLQPHVYKKGQSGNLNGRPKGTISLKEYAKRMIQDMTPEEREEYLQGLDKKFIWEMAEGKAEAKTEATVKLAVSNLNELSDEQLEQLAKQDTGGESEEGAE